MLVLAFDTSTAATWAVVCRVGDRAVDVLAGNNSVDARAHGERLAPNIAASLEEADATAQDLDAIVVGTGPGPFTGLRVGLVTAAVLSDTLGIPAYGVCSLDGIAAGADALLVATDARRREVYWARYRDGARIDGPHVSSPADVPLDGLTAMAGAGARLYQDLLGLPLLDVDYPDPAALIAVARDRIVNGAPSEPLTPRYLRRPDAVAPGAPKAVSQ